VGGILAWLERSALRMNSPFLAGSITPITSALANMLGLLTSR
jgi:hypothetical protein